MRRSVAVVMSGFPRVSETFALGELAALAADGRLAGIFATKAGDLAAVQPEARDLLPHLHLLVGEPKDQAAELAGRLAGRDVAGIHGYFAHRPADVAGRAAVMLGVPFTFGGHALDTRTAERDTLGRNASNAAAVLACNDDAASALRSAGAQVTLLPHGVDLSRFRPGPERHGSPMRVLAVGRFVEKKGFDVLVEALARTTRPVVLRMVGDGPTRAATGEAIAARGLAERVELVGRRTHDGLPVDYAWADAVAVPSVVDAAGDRDGLPNVVLEALASGRAVVATDVGAIGAAVTDGVTGLVVPPRDPAALAAALDRLAIDPALRARLGRRGRSLVARRYDRERQTRRFVDTLEHAYAA